MRTGDGLWRALEQARRANLADSGEAAPITGHWGTTRRSVLKALGGAGAIAAFPQPLAAAPVGKVAIIGGGIAGLTALHYLTEAGVDAQVYEARNRAGGRMHTVRQNGVTFERGGQLVNTDHDDMHALLKAFGIELVDRKQGAHRTIVVESGREIPQAELARELRGIAGQIDADAKLLDQDYARHAPRFDRLSMAGYLDQHAALIGKPWARHLMEQTARTEYGAEPTQASAIELLFNLPVVEGERVEVLGGSDERFVIAGGSSTLTNALADKYRSRIALGRRPIRIERRRGAMRLTFLDLSTVEVDRVIVAVPASLANYIEYAVPLPAQWRAFLQVMQLGRCEKLQWAMRDTPWRKTMGMGGEGWSADAASPSALVWDGTVHGNDASGTPIWNFFTGGAQVTDAEVAPHDFARVFAPIADLEPARAASLTANRTAWHKDPMAMGAYSNFPPGQLSRFAGLLSVDDGSETQYSAAGGIVFAGEHLSDAFPGYMNGAAQTGRMAAEAIVGHKISKVARRAA